MADSKVSALDEAPAKANISFYAVDPNEAAAADRSKKAVFGTFINAIVTKDGELVIKDGDIVMKDQE